MQEENFPNLFRMADRRALTAQKIYFRFERLRLGLLIAGSSAPLLYATSGGGGTSLLDSLVLMVLMLIIIMSFWSKNRGDDEVWFECRAIAESAKALAWRYMVGMRPFDGDEKRTRFVNGLKEIRDSRGSMAQHLAAAKVTEGAAITQFMDNVNQKGFEERKKFYIISRMQDQREWYAGKAKRNSELNNCSFTAFIVLQSAAIASAVAKLTGYCEVSVVPILMTTAAALIAWGETRRYSELAQSYLLASQELEEQVEIATEISSEPEFLEFIGTVEDTISREHTLWCVKRNR